MSNYSKEVIDQKTGKKEKVISQTSNSYLVTQTKLTENGIDCDQWFTERDFLNRFKIIENG